MKIFIAVGTQLAFDRLLKAVDEWAAKHPEAEIFAQGGPAEYVPQHMESQNFVEPTVFEQKSGEADVIIAHAGTGTIFLALELGKPIIVMPRRASLGEHRNDHQFSTVQKFQTIQGVNVAWDEVDLAKMLDDLEGLEKPDAEFSRYARPQLLRTISDHINDTPPPRKRDRIKKLLRSLKV